VLYTHSHRPVITKISFSLRFSFPLCTKEFIKILRKTFISIRLCASVLLYNKIAENLDELWISYAPVYANIFTKERYESLPFWLLRQSRVAIWRIPVNRDVQVSRSIVWTRVKHFTEWTSFHMVCCRTEIQIPENLMAETDLSRSRVSTMNYPGSLTLVEVPGRWVFIIDYVSTILSTNEKRGDLFDQKK